MPKSKTKKIVKKSKPKTKAKSKPKPKPKPKPKKKIVVIQEVESKEKPIGVISHYFSAIGVVIIKLSAPLAEGDEIRIIGGEKTDFNQVIKSMQMNHKEIKKAKKGQSIGVKVKEIAREGYRVYKA